jgi:ribosomal protein L11 methyltransferase
VAIDQALLIKPSWTRRRARAGRAVVVIDPGLSFGTGQHPTTRYCLQQIVAVRDAEKGQSFLDVGTGSGILAIAAIRLGFSPVAAFDVDPVAVRIAGANARGNRVAGRIRFRCVDVSRLPIRAARRFDLICANLTADLLVTEAGRLARRLRPGGRLVVAGVLRREFDAVRQAFRRAGLRLTRSRVEEEWRSGVFSAPPKMAT